MNLNRLTLRPLEDRDIALMDTWLHKPYILKWYLDADDWLEELRGRHGEYAWLHHFIVMDGDIPVGFCQYYDAHDADAMEDWYSVDATGDTYSIDYLIGNEAYLGKGYGKQIVRLLTDRIRETTPARHIIVQPDRENHASNGVLLANGYRFNSEKDYYELTLR